MSVLYGFAFLGPDESCAEIRLNNTVILSGCTEMSEGVTGLDKSSVQRGRQS